MSAGDESRRQQRGTKAFLNVTMRHMLVMALDGFTAAVSALLPMTTWPAAEIERETSWALTLVCCTMVTYAFLTLYLGVAVYEPLLRMENSRAADEFAFGRPRMAVAVLPLMWSANPKIAEALVSNACLKSPDTVHSMMCAYALFVCGTVLCRRS